MCCTNDWQADTGQLFGYRSFCEVVPVVVRCAVFDGCPLSINKGKICLLNTLFTTLYYGCVKQFIAYATLDDWNENEED